MIVYVHEQRVEKLVKLANMGYACYSILELDKHQFRLKVTCDLMEQLVDVFQIPRFWISSYLSKEYQQFGKVVNCCFVDRDATGPSYFREFYLIPQIAISNLFQVASINITILARVVRRPVSSLDSILRPRDQALFWSTYLWKRQDD